MRACALLLNFQSVIGVFFPSQRQLVDARDIHSKSGSKYKVGRSSARLSEEARFAGMLAHVLRKRKVANSMLLAAEYVLEKKSRAKKMMQLRFGVSLTRYHATHGVGEFFSLEKRCQNPSPSAYAHALRYRECGGSHRSNFGDFPGVCKQGFHGSQKLIVANQGSNRRKSPQLHTGKACKRFTH